MVKILVVYYSLTGNTRLIAEEISKTVKCNLLEIKPVKEINPKGSMKFLWGGFQATMKKTPDLKPHEINPENYDLIFLGTPVWAWNVSPPIRSFIEKHDFSNKTLALWMCAGGEGGKSMQRYKETLKKSKILGEILFQEPKQKDTESAKQRASEWAKDIILKMNE